VHWPGGRKLPLDPREKASSEAFLFYINYLPVYFLFGMLLAKSMVKPI